MSISQNASKNSTKTELLHDFNSLTTRAANKYENDVHISPFPRETSMEVSVGNSLRSLRACLDTMDNKEKKCYLDALDNGADMTNSDTELALFLRSESFDSKVRTRYLISSLWNRMEKYQQFSFDVK